MKFVRLHPLKRLFFWPFLPFYQNHWKLTLFCSSIFGLIKILLLITYFYLNSNIWSGVLTTSINAHQIISSVCFSKCIILASCTISLIFSHRKLLISKDFSLFQVKGLFWNPNSQIFFYFGTKRPTRKEMLIKFFFYFLSFIFIHFLNKKGPQTWCIY